MAENRKKRLSFRRAVLIYIAAFAVLALSALGVLYGFLSAYEASRPDRQAETYLSAARRTLPDACSAALAEAQLLMQDGEAERCLGALLDRAELSKAPLPELADDMCAFTLSSDGAMLGTIYMKQTEKGAFGLRSWQLEREEYDLSPFLKRVAVTLPEGYSVSVNGRALGSESIKNAGLAYACLSDFYEYYASLPRLTEYLSGSYLGDAEISIRDEAGRPVPYGELSEALFLDNCSGEERQRICDFVETFIARYVVFAADVGGSTEDNYAGLEQLVAPGSPLHRRMSKALGSFGYSNTAACELLELTVNICSDLGGGLYFADVSYLTEIQGLADPVTTENKLRLILTETGGGLKAQTLFHY